MDTLVQHLQLCDELHQLVLEENRFIKRHAGPPDPALVARRKALLDRLDVSLRALKNPATAAVPSDTSLRAERASVIEKSRARVLQILNIQRENEQLLLRPNLGPTRMTMAATPPPASQLQKLYDRHG